jgi:hypothetical protein
MFEQLKFNFGDVVRSENEREPRPSYWRLRLKREADHPRQVCLYQPLAEADGQAGGIGCQFT